MQERSGDPMEMKRYFHGIHAMLDELEDRFCKMTESFGERGNYGERGGYGERSDYRYGERDDMMERRGGGHRY